MSANISIPNFPSNQLTPGFFFAVDATNANTGTVTQRALIIGQQLSNSTNNPVVGSLTPGVPVLAGSVQQVQMQAGPGSILALQYAAFRAVNPTCEVWLLPLADDSAAVSATAAIAITGTATGAGVLSLYAGGQVVPCAVSAGDTPAVIGANLKAAIKNQPNIPFVVGTASGTTTYSLPLTAKNGGALGNDIDLRLNYQGPIGGESTPPGVTVAFTAFASGAQNPTTLAAALANLASVPYDFINMPYFDTTSLNLGQAFLNDTAGRWSWSQQIFGHILFAYRGTPSARATFAATRNDQHASYIGFYDSPTTVWEWGAAFTAAVATSVLQDPALPVTGYVLPVLAPPQASIDTLSIQNTMLLDGVSTYTVNSRQVVVSRCTTSYVTNPTTGAPDNSYRDIETMYTLIACIRDMRIFLSNQFARKKLVSDATPIAGGSGMVSAKTILAAAISRYRTQCTVFGWAQNPDDFAAQARASNQGGGQVNLVLPYQLANQLRVCAIDVAFTKP